MNTANVEKAIRDFHDTVSEAEAVMGELNEVLGMSPDSRLYSAVWALGGALKDALDAAYGIGGWLEWWWLECSLGRNPMQAGWEGAEMRTITTVDDLVRLIIDDLERAA